jgi:peptidoglycan/LPS O-acetylase OafA/YrhL
MRHRLDIDGLRALAIVPVVLFHAGFGLFGGGFIGVDIFFVISGFLITGIIQKEIGDSRFSLREFYDRRLRRIFPALYTVLAVSAVAGLLILSPQDLEAFGKSLISSATFVANMYFMTDSDYFSADSRFKPLLHMWSLAVEEQFYLFFPLFLIVIKKLPFRRLLIWLSLLGSFALSVYVLHFRDNATAFYFAPVRAWELLVGSVVALGLVPRPKAAWANEALAWLGLAMILVPVFVYTDKTPFPGEYALPPCMGAALLILTGGGEQPTMVGRVLSLKPVVFVGLISYSLYLWHWPILSFWSSAFVVPLTVLDKCLAIAAAVLVAYASWRWIEAPFRRRSHSPDQKRLAVFTASGGVLAAAVVAGVLFVGFKGFPARIPPKALAVVAAAKATTGSMQPVLNEEKPNFRPPEQGAIVGTGTPDVILWGDSHAVALLPGLQAASGGRAIRVLTMRSCGPTVFGDYEKDEKPACRSYNNAVIKYLANAPEKTVVLSKYWMFGSETGALPDQTQKERALADLLDKLAADGKTVYLVGATPQAPYDIARYVFQQVRFQPGVSDLSLDLSGHQAPYVTMNDHLKQLADARKDDHFIDPMPALCTGLRCVLYRSGAVYYSDRHHLSVEGSRSLAPIFAPVFAR